MNGNLTNPITVKRLDAALAQMVTATHLYFGDGDEVSIYSLARAAHESIRALYKKPGARNMFANGIFLDFVRPEHRERIGKLFNKPKNYFKYEGIMRSESIEFYPDTSAWLLFDAGMGYHQLTGTLPSALSVFRTWHTLKNYQILVGAETKQTSSHWSALMRGMTRPLFFAVATGTITFPEAQVAISKISSCVRPGILE